MVAAGGAGAVAGAVVCAIHYTLLTPKIVIIKKKNTIRCEE